MIIGQKNSIQSFGFGSGSGGMAVDLGLGSAGDYQTLEQTHDQMIDFMLAAEEVAFTPREALLQNKQVLKMSFNNLPSVGLSNSNSGVGIGFASRQEPSHMIGSEFKKAQFNENTD